MWLFRTMHSVRWTNIHKNARKRLECALNIFGPASYPLCSGQLRLPRSCDLRIPLSSGEHRLVGVAVRILLLSSDGHPLRWSSDLNIGFCMHEPLQQKTQPVRIVFFEHYIRLSTGFSPFRIPLPSQRTVSHRSMRRSRSPHKKG